MLIFKNANFLNINLFFILVSILVLHTINKEIYYFIAFIN